MAKQNSSFFSLLTELPWWVSVVVAGATYVGLTLILPNIETGNPIIDMSAKSFAYAGPFFAGLFLLAAPFAFFNRRRKRKLLDNQRSIDSIKALSWKEFEELVAEFYRRDGFIVAENGFGADGGIDIRIIKDKRTSIVQCKRWRTKNVGVAIVREMYGVLNAENAANVIIICCGGFSADAITFAQNKPIELIGGTELLKMIKSIQPSHNIAQQVGSESVFTNVTTDNKAKPNKVKLTQAATACPKCGNHLIIRKAKRGVNAGNQFLGCASFPQCRYTLNLSSSTLV